MHEWTGARNRIKLDTQYSVRVAFAHILGDCFKHEKARRDQIGRKSGGTVGILYLPQ